MLVNEQVWVEFTMGNYQDKIPFDVLPMDVCHVFLGRPWQYDRELVHHGKENKYSFKKDGVT